MDPLSSLSNKNFLTNLKKGDRLQQQASALKKGNETEQKDRELKKASDSFEELFVHYLIKDMRKATPKSDFMSGGDGEEIFQDMLDDEYAKIITKNGGDRIEQVYDGTIKKIISQGFLENADKRDIPMFSIQNP